MIKAMKKRKTIIIGLFVLMGILFNITIYFDNSGAQDSDLALSDLRVSLVDKAYASGIGPVDWGEWFYTYHYGFLCACPVPIYRSQCHCDL